MKKKRIPIAAFCFFVSWFAFSAAIPGIARAAGTHITYDEFQKRAAEHRKNLDYEGLSYMLGGGIGLGSALYLGITSKETLPKVGYSLIQILSSTAIAYGAYQYNVGDDFTAEAERLQNLSEKLSSVRSISSQERKRVLDEMAGKAVENAARNKKRLKRIRGTLELVTAASSGATFAFSQNPGTASSVTLGFIVLVSLGGGISDLLTATSESGYETFSLRVDPFPTREHPSYFALDFHY